MLISIIIPITPDKTVIASNFNEILAQRCNIEIVLVDGQITSQHQSMAHPHVKWLHRPMAKRSDLLNAGANTANGDVLLFLWPESLLPASACQAIENNLALLTQTIGGNFHVKFHHNTVFYRLVAWMFKKWRYMGHYYGNSGIFVQREVFRALGGFNSGVLEDYDFARRMERYGPTIYLPEIIIDTSQRFRRRPLQTLWRWMVMYPFFALKDRLRN